MFNEKNLKVDIIIDQLCCKVEVVEIYVYFSQLFIIFLKIFLEFEYEVLVCVLDDIFF